MNPMKIGKMSLKNYGAFVTRITFSYVCDDSGEKKLSQQSQNITLGFMQTIDPGELGVPNGAMVSMYAFIVWGKDNEAKELFIYEEGNLQTAHYVISGTTYSNKLELIPMEDQTNHYKWSNWAGNISTNPDLILSPLNIAELRDIIIKNPNKTIRAVGTGHSWTPLVVTTGIIVDTARITKDGCKAWRWQKNGLNLVTYLPSAKWADVRNALVDPQNALPRMYLSTAGVLPSINATGFVAAGCHGTGWFQPTVSDLIYSIKIVASDGRIHEFSEETTPDEMNIIRVNLGMFGIISEITLKVDLMYCLWDQEYIVPTADIMGPNPLNNNTIETFRLNDSVTGNDYVELFWFPGSGIRIGSKTLHDGSIWVKKYNRTNDDIRDIPQSLPAWQVRLAEILMQTSAEHPSLFWPIVCQMTWNKLSHDIQKIEKKKGFIAEAPRVLHYDEDAFPVMDLEIAIPIPSTDKNSWDFTNIIRAWYLAINYVRHKYQNSVYPLTCCLHARFIKNSQALISPAYEPVGSNTHYCWIEVLSAYPKENINPEIRKRAIADYEELVNTIGPTWINDMNGRPHWAKYWQHIPNINIRSLFPESNFSSLNKLRQRLDPKGMFLNGYLKDLNL